MLNSCSSMHVKSQSCIVLFDLLLQQLYGILGQPSYTSSETFMPLKNQPSTHVTKFIQVVFCIETSIKVSYPKRTHFIVVARVSNDHVNAK